MGLHSDQASDSTRLRPVSRGSVGGRPHVVIVGAGFGGLTAAKGLAKAAVEVTLIDRENHHLFQPLLYQVATAGLSPTEIAWPIRGLVRRQRNTRVLLCEVTCVERGRHVVTMGDREVPYDFLVLATGATHAYFGNDGWAEHAPGLKSMDDATEIRRRLLIAFERPRWRTIPKSANGFSPLSSSAVARLAWRWPALLRNWLAGRSRPTSGPSIPGTQGCC
jgi:NADH dehydrogenase